LNSQQHILGMFHNLFLHCSALTPNSNAPLRKVASIAVSGWQQAARHANTIVTAHDFLSNRQPQQAAEAAAKHSARTLVVCIF